MVNLTSWLDVLKSSFLFRNLSDEEIEQVIMTMSPRIVSFEKRETVAQDGALLSEIGLILSGNVHLVHCDEKGNNNLMETLGEGEAFGELNAVGMYSLNIAVVTTKPTKILFMSVEQLLRKHVLTAPTQIRFLQNLTLQMARKAQRLTKKIEESTRRSTRERLQDYLSHEYHKTGSRTFAIPLNRQDLADFLFVDRSAMSAELCRMRDEGLLKFEKSRFELLIEMPITEEKSDPNDEDQ